MKKDESLQDEIFALADEKQEDESSVLRKQQKKSNSVYSSELLKGKFLVHVGSTQNEMYNQSVIYITDCTSEHVRGIMINKLLFGTATIECKGKENNKESILRNVYEELYQGGPENPAHGYVLFPKEDISDGDPFAEVLGDIAVSTSFGVLQEILDGEGPSKKIIAMGHCEWHRGELEWEIFNNQWLIIPSSIEIMFDTAFEERWARAKALSGFDERLAISYVGLA